MEYKTGKFSLNEAQQNLRIGLVSLIREHVERGMSKDDLVQVIESLEFALSEHRFKERSEDEQFYDMVYSMPKKVKDE